MEGFLEFIGLCIIKDKNRNLTRDILLTVLCIAFWVGIILFIRTEAGDSFFNQLKQNLPFMNIITDALNDLDKMGGQLFGRFGLNSSFTGIEAEAQEITLLSLFFDLSKLLLAKFIQSLLFLGCSYLFLYAGNENLVTKILGGEKKDILYYINSGTLLGITMLVGGVAAVFVMRFVQTRVALLDTMNQLYTSFGIFVLLYILYSLYSMFTSKLSKGGAFSFRRSLLKTLVYNVVPEMLTFFVTNLLTVIMLNTFASFGFHLYSVGILLAYIIWSNLAKFVESMFTKWFNAKIPFMGKYCPFSGIFWLGGTASICLLCYFMALPNMDSAPQSILEKYLYTLPFLQEWADGASISDLLLHHFDAYLLVVINLVVICTAASALQYFTSSYIPTLFLQIFVRLFFLMGCSLLCIIVSYMISEGLVIPWIQSSDICGLLIMIFTFFYFLFFAFQPLLALQGLLSAASLLLLLHLIPAASIYTETEAGLGMFLGAACIVIGVGCLLPLLQNIVAVLEKNFIKKLYAPLDLIRE